MGPGTWARGASGSWGGGPGASRSGESKSPGMASAARSTPVRVAAACSLLLPPPLGRGLACGARAGGRVVGGGGLLASVVRAAGKASVSLVPPVAAAGGCGAAGLRGCGRWEGAGAGGWEGEGFEGVRV